MVQAIRMPMMGNTMEIGLLAEWQVEKGDHVEKDDVIAIVESEKATAEVTAKQDGILERIDVREGEEVPPGTVLGVVLGPDEELNEAPDPRSRIAPTTDEGGDETEEPEGQDLETAREITEDESESSKAVKAVPGARKFATEHGIDLEAIEGSGPDGTVLLADIEEQIEREGGIAEHRSSNESREHTRTFARPSTRRLARELDVSIQELDVGAENQRRITDSDVRRAAGLTDRTAQTVDPATSTETALAKSDTDALGVTVEEERELSQIRRTIAERMAQSARQAPHVTNKRDIDVGSTLEAVDELSENYDPSIGFLDVLILAVRRGLETHPEFNAWFEADRLRLISEINVAIAVDAEGGLVTPVIRETETCSIVDIARERRRLTDAVLEGEYSMEDIEGGTFTISNLGMFGVDSFDPIINPPQVAILGVGRIRKADSEPTCTLSLSFDHRVVDGADAARFLDTIVQGVESPTALVTETATDGRSRAEALDDTQPTRDVASVAAVVSRDLEKQARAIAAEHGWPTPTYEVSLSGDQPSITVNVPADASPATAKRLTYAACRESAFKEMIAGLHDPELTVT